MQLSLPLCGVTAPPSLAWEHVEPDHQLEAVATLARLMTQLVQPELADEEHAND